MTLLNLPLDLLIISWFAMKQFAASELGLFLLSLLCAGGASIFTARKVPVCCRQFNRRFEFDRWAWLTVGGIASLSIILLLVVPSYSRLGQAVNARIDVWQRALAADAVFKGR